MDLAARAGLGVQADLVVQADRAVQADPGARAAHLGRARQALAGLGVQDAPVRVVNELKANWEIQARSAG